MEQAIRRQGRRSNTTKGWPRPDCPPTGEIISTDAAVTDTVGDYLLSGPAMLTIRCAVVSDSAFLLRTKLLTHRDRER